MVAIDAKTSSEAINRKKGTKIPAANIGPSMAANDPSPRSAR